MTTGTTPEILFPYRVTPEQLNRCHRIFDEQAGTAFYQVERESEPTEDDPAEEYEVRWKDGWTCTCKSGKTHFTNVRHPSGTCKHVRWSACREIEYQRQQRTQATAEQQQALPFDEGQALYESRERGRLAIIEAQRMAREAMPHCE